LMPAGRFAYEPAWLSGRFYNAWRRISLGN
jgi:hypothetical protein